MIENNEIAELRKEFAILRNKLESLERRAKLPKRGDVVEYHSTGRRVLLTQDATDDELVGVQVNQYDKMQGKALSNWSDVDYSVVGHVDLDYLFRKLEEDDDE